MVIHQRVASESRSGENEYFSLRGPDHPRHCDRRPPPPQKTPHLAKKVIIETCLILGPEEEGKKKKEKKKKRIFKKGPRGPCTTSPAHPSGDDNGEKRNQEKKKEKEKKYQQPGLLQAPGWRNKKKNRGKDIQHHAQNRK